MPLPTTILESLMGHVQLKFTAAGQLGLIQFPPERKLSRLLAEAGGKNLTISSEEINDELHEAMFDQLKQWGLKGTAEPSEPGQQTPPRHQTGERKETAASMTRKLIQDGMDDDAIYQAVLAVFPTYRRSSVDWYRKELKK